MGSASGSRTPAASVATPAIPSYRRARSGRLSGAVARCARRHVPLAGPGSPPRQNALPSAPVRMITPAHGSSRMPLPHGHYLTHSYLRLARRLTLTSVTSLPANDRAQPGETDPPRRRGHDGDRPLQAVLVSGVAGAARLVEPLARALHGTGPALLPLGADLPAGKDR